MAIGKVTNRTARKNLRRKSMTSPLFDVGAASPNTNQLVGKLPDGSRAVVDSIKLVWQEAYVDAGTDATIVIGHSTTATALDDNSLVTTKLFVSGAIAARAIVNQTITSLLKTHAAWQGKAVLPAGSVIWVTIGDSSSPTSGKFCVVVDYWEFDDEYD